MTDYTPENRIQEAVDLLHSRETSAEKSLKFTDRKFAELVREASRLKEEKDELLKLVSSFSDAVDMDDNWGKLIALSLEARELIAKVGK